MKNPTLKNWEIVRAEGSMFAKGYVFNHPHYEDNTLIITGKIVDGGGGFLHTVEASYQLRN